MKDNFMHRLYVYQKERFPVNVLTFTTLAVILSSFAISFHNSIPNSYISTILLALLSGMIFMFHIRVLDDSKDNQFDNQYHS